MPSPTTPSTPEAPAVGGDAPRRRRDHRYLDASRRVVCFGESQLASLAHFYLTHDSPHEVVAFCVDAAYRNADTFEGKPLLDFETVAEAYPPSEYLMFLPISFKRMSHFRRERYEAAKAMGYSCISYVSSRATFYDVDGPGGLDVGENCFVFEDNTLQPYVSVGDNCVLWSGNHVGHHTRIASHCFLTSHVVISGACTIEEHAFFGVNATVRDETVVARETLVGMGAIISKDTEPFGVYLGARPHKLPRRSDQLETLSHKSGG